MIYKNITREEYDALEGVNNSTLKHFRDSTKYGAYKKNASFNPTAAMRVGTAAHTLTLEPEKFDEEYIIGGPINEKTGKTYGSDSAKFKNWLEDQEPGKKFLSDQEATLARKVARNTKQDKTAMFWLDQCEYKETAIDWVDPYSGLKCKALLDAFSIDNLIFADYKTIGKSVSYDELSKTIYNMGYYQQFAFYNDGLFHNGIHCNDVIAVFAQTADEKDVATARIGRESLDLGRMHYQQCFDNYKSFLAGDVKGHNSELFELNVPGWATRAMEEEEEFNFINQIKDELCETL